MTKEATTVAARLVSGLQLANHSTVYNRVYVRMYVRMYIQYVAILVYCLPITWLWRIPIYFVCACVCTYVCDVLCASLPSRPRTSILI